MFDQVLHFRTLRHKERKYFHHYFVNMIRAGELTGNLDETLDRLAFYYEKQHALKKKIQSTMMYPAVLLIHYYYCSRFFLMLTIVPTFTAMFADFGAELPFITVFVMAISDLFKVLVVDYYYWLL